MNAKQEKETIYYSDEVNDEFSGFHKDTVTIGEDFKYIRKNIFYRILTFIVYRLIMTPIAFIHMKLKFHLKTVNAGVLKKYKKTGYFLYRNHTLSGGDAFIPNVLSFPQRCYVIVNADNISTPGTKNFVMMCGAIPIPQSMTVYRNFLNAVEKRILQKACITVYPEAHIWPYYTKIRKFSQTSFRYPVKFNTPVFTATTVFTPPKHGNIPRVMVYVDGPFFPDTENPRGAGAKLCNQVYETMCKRAENSTYEAVHYIKKEAPTV